MTDRYVALTVALEKDMREDDAEALIDAIKRLRGVADVTGYIAAPHHWAIEARVRHELGAKLLAICYPQEDE